MRWGILIALVFSASQVHAGGDLNRNKDLRSNTSTPVLPTTVVKPSQTLKHVPTLLDRFLMLTTGGRVGLVWQPGKLKAKHAEEDDFEEASQAMAGGAEVEEVTAAPVESAAPVEETPTEPEQPEEPVDEGMPSMQTVAVGEEAAAEEEGAQEAPAFPPRKERGPGKLRKLFARNYKKQMKRRARPKDIAITEKFVVAEDGESRSMRALIGRKVKRGECVLEDVTLTQYKKGRRFKKVECCEVHDTWEVPCNHFK